MSRPVKHWQRPQVSYLKTNWDIATNSVICSFGLGGITRDRDGEIMPAFCSNLPTCFKPEIVEALALRKAMIMC